MYLHFLICLLLGKQTTRDILKSNYLLEPNKNKEYIVKNMFVYFSVVNYKL